MNRSKTLLSFLENIDSHDRELTVRSEKDLPKDFEDFYFEGDLTVRSEKDLPKDFEGYFYFEGDNTPYYTFLDDEAQNGRVVQPADAD